MIALVNVYGMFTPAELPIGEEPSCGTDDGDGADGPGRADGAPAVPCIAALPAGWSVGGVRVRRGDARFWLDSDQAGGHAVEVRLRPPAACALGDATEVPSTEPGWRVFERPEQLLPALRSVRTFVADGACVTYTLRVRPTGSAPRRRSPSTSRWPSNRGTELVAEVADRSGLVLCGAGAPPCPGGEG